MPQERSRAQRDGHDDAEKERLRQAAGLAPRADPASTSGPPGQEAALPAKPAKQEVSFHTSVGRAVHDYLFNRQRSNVREAFLPRRMAFVFQLGAGGVGEDEDVDELLGDNGGLDSDIPTTLRRSKADCPQVRVAGAGGVVHVVGVGWGGDDYNVFYKHCNS